MNLTNCKSFLRALSSRHLLWQKVSNILLLLVILFLTVVLLKGNVARAENIPLAVHSRYISLANNFEKAPQELKFHRDIAAFYRQQLTKSTARQLLASNLHLQVLLQQKNYSEAYQVVSTLLPQKLVLQQLLQFQQLASQLVLSKNSQDKSALTKQDWLLAIGHLQAWFAAVEVGQAKAKKLTVKGLTAKEITMLNIGSKQQAINAALLAQSYYQVTDLSAALPWAQRAYRAIPDNETYLKLLLALQGRLENYAQLNKLLAVAVIDFPLSKAYWPRWAYSFLRLDSPKKALSTLAIARNQDKLDKQGYHILASLYLSQQQPRLSAQVLLEGESKQVINADEKYYKSLTNAWLLARDRQQALDTYAQAEAVGIKLAKSQQRQAQLSYIEGNWSGAETIYNELLQANKNSTVERQNLNEITASSMNLEQQEKWRFMLAMTQVQQNKNNLAKANLEKLTTKKYQRYAKSWLAQING